jgi:hypothetical protein
MKIFCASVLAAVAAISYMVDKENAVAALWLAVFVAWLVWLDSDSK